MKKYTCIIVDDEILARELMANHIAKIPYLEIIASCPDAISAKLALQQLQPDILFLDINMPELTGIELLRMLHKRPATIITTAYSEHSVEGYELEVLDYILKPIEFDRFFKAVAKAVEWIDYRRKSYNEPAPANINELAIPYFFVKADYKIIKVIFDEILFIEALQKYVRIQTKTERIISLMSMSHLEDILPAGLFFRIHRSYIINLDKIDSIEGNIIHIQKHELPLSKAQRESFLELLRSRTFGEHKPNW